MLSANINSITLYYKTDGTDIHTWNFSPLQICLYVGFFVFAWEIGPR